MKIRVNRFCALSTAKDWQTWLFKYNQELYSEFIAQLRLSQGCNDNRMLMENFLTRIDQLGGMPPLIEFLRAHYSHLIVDDNILQSSDPKWDKLFGNEILTYPRRKLLVGSRETLPQLVENFISDKINCSVLIVNDRAYIEYLDKNETHLFDHIPAKNWLIKGEQYGQSGTT